MGEDFWFGLLMLGAATVGGAILALRWLRIARLVEDTPTSRVRSAAQGYVELIGRGLQLEGGHNFGPLTRRPCVWWRYRVSKRQQSGSGRGDHWRVVASGTSTQPFLLDDGTGHCMVQPDGAEIVTGESTTWYGDAPWPAGAPGAARPASRDYRYFEERIYEQERVYVLGNFRSHRPDDAVDLEAAANALAREWKEDQSALVARFDADGDGRVDLAEWARARAEARRLVEQQARDRPASGTVHVVGRPDEGQLFLIAALPPGDLARRYRRRAVIAFVGFVAAAYAVGRLLQGAFG